MGQAATKELKDPAEGQAREAAEKKNQKIRKEDEKARIVKTRNGVNQKRQDLKKKIEAAERQLQTDTPNIIRKKKREIEILRKMLPKTETIFKDLDGFIGGNGICFGKVDRGLLYEYRGKLHNEMGLHPTAELQVKKNVVTVVHTNMGTGESSRHTPDKVREMFKKAIRNRISSFQREIRNRISSFPKLISSFQTIKQLGEQIELLDVQINGLNLKVKGLVEVIEGLAKEIQTLKQEANAIREKAKEELLKEQEEKAKEQKLKEQGETKKRRLAAMLPSHESLASETGYLPSSGPSAVSLGLVATAGLCAAFVLRRFYNRFTAKRRDSFGFLPDSRRPSLNAAERMV